MATRCGRSLGLPRVWLDPVGFLYCSGRLYCEGATDVFCRAVCWDSCALDLASKIGSETLMDKEMLAITFVAALNVLVLVIFRTAALSRHSEKMVESTIWGYDVGTRYGWLTCGAALLVLFLYKSIDMLEWFYCLALWLLGAWALWEIPPRLAKRI